MKAEKDNCYYYKGNEYIVKDFSKMKNPATGEWVNSVLYANKKKPYESYCRELNDFECKFIPCVLDEYSCIIGICMGRITGKYEFSKRNLLYLEFKNSSGECLNVKQEIKPNGEITVIEGAHQATEYYYLTKELENSISKRFAMGEVIKNLDDFSLKLKKMLTNGELPDNIFNVRNTINFTLNNILFLKKPLSDNAKQELKTIEEKIISIKRKIAETCIYDNEHERLHNELIDLEMRYNIIISDNND